MISNFRDYEESETTEDLIWDVFGNIDSEFDVYIEIEKRNWFHKIGQTTYQKCLYLVKFKFDAYPPPEFCERILELVNICERYCNLEFDRISIPFRKSGSKNDILSFLHRSGLPAIERGKNIYNSVEDLNVDGLEITFKEY
jgi:hypothetical protein